jgi:thiol-disulfide isomerase/thioredoxin
MKNIYLLIGLFMLISCKQEIKKETTNTAEKSAEITVKEIDYNDLELLLNKNDGKTYVINFWATWCKPCVEELPAFQELYENYKDKNVEVILISLDFKKQLDSRLIPFIKEHNLKPTVLLMVDPDQNTWIPKVSTEWSGAIPATIIYNNNNRGFYEESFTYQKLENELTKFLKNN